MTRPGLPILAYHSLDRSVSPISTDPAWFASTMSALSEAGYRTVDLAEWVASGRPPVERGFAVSFDDGLRSVLDAADILARHGFTATVFLATGRMGGDNAWPGQPRGIPRLAVLSWSEASSLRSAGFRFAAHTRSHPRLDHLDPSALAMELRGSRDDVEGRLGVSCPLFAYPYGIAPPLVRLAVSQVFEAAFGTRLGLASTWEDSFEISRIDAYEIRTSRALDALIRGRESARFGIRRAIRGARRAILAN